MLTQCCVCKKIRSRDMGWNPPLEHEQHLIDLGNVSHGYCPQCFEKAVVELRASNTAKPEKSSQKSIAAVLKGIVWRVEDPNDTMFRVLTHQEVDAVFLAAEILEAE